MASAVDLCDSSDCSNVSIVLMLKNSSYIVRKLEMEQIRKLKKHNNQLFKKTKKKYIPHVLLFASAVFDISRARPIFCREKHLVQ